MRQEVFCKTTALSLEVEPSVLLTTTLPRHLPQALEQLQATINVSTPQGCPRLSIKRLQINVAKINYDIIPILESFMESSRKF